jgi:hypothetical protein
MRKVYKASRAALKKEDLGREPVEDSAAFARPAFSERGKSVHVELRTAPSPGADGNQRQRWRVPLSKTGEIGAPVLEKPLN